jgi:hypothetical protein
MVTQAQGNQSGNGLSIFSRNNNWECILPTRVVFVIGSERSTRFLFNKAVPLAHNLFSGFDLESPAVMPVHFNIKFCLLL